LPGQLLDGQDISVSEIEIRIKTADPKDTNVLVLNPAFFNRYCLSAPINVPNKKASAKRVKYTDSVILIGFLVVAKVEE